jgi:hypothetical protein
MAVRLCGMPTADAAGTEIRDAPGCGKIRAGMRQDKRQEVL